VLSGFRNSQHRSIHPHILNVDCNPQRPLPHFPSSSLPKSFRFRLSVMGRECRVLMQTEDYELALSAGRKEDTWRLDLSLASSIPPERVELLDTSVPPLHRLGTTESLHECGRGGGFPFFPPPPNLTPDARFCSVLFFSADDVSDSILNSCLSRLEDETSRGLSNYSGCPPLSPHAPIPSPLSGRKCGKRSDDPFPLLAVC